MVKFYLPEKLQKRIKLSYKLSTFLDFYETDCSIEPRYKQDRGLRLNLGYLQNSDTQFYLLFTTDKEAETVLHLFDRVLIGDRSSNTRIHDDRTLNHRHILSYFEEACYQAVRVRCKAWIDFEHPRDTFELYWQIGRGILSNIDRLNKILTRYDRTCSKKIENYVREVLIFEIRDEYYQKTGQGKRTIWGALKVESQTRLRKYLQLYGITELMVSSYLLAWNCFFQVYQPSGEGKRRKFLDPCQQDFERAVELYQIKREQYLEIENTHLSQINAERLKDLLETCIGAMQYSANLAKKQPEIISLNGLTHTEMEKSWSVIQQKVADPLGTDNFELAQNSEEYQSEIDRLLQDQMCELRQKMLAGDRSPDRYVFLVLCYGLGLKQSEAAILILINGFNIDRSSISREITKLKTSLIERLSNHFRDKIESIGADEHFDRNLNRWSKKRQKDVEEGLRGYLREEIIEAVSTFALPHLSEQNQFDNPRSFWKYYLHLWSRKTLDMALIWENLPTQLDPKKAEKLTKRIELFVQQLVHEGTTKK